MHLRKDIGFDSLDLAELTVRIEAEYDIDIFEDGIVNTVGEILKKMEEQVKDIFFSKTLIMTDLLHGTYLIDDINNTSIYNPYCKSADYYTAFKQIILSLLIDEEIILLDSRLY